MLIDLSRIVQIIILALTICKKSTGTAQEDWYSRYESYPEYCSTPTQMSSRSIPKLSGSTKKNFPNTKLVQVTAIIRHGARTPFGAYPCWDGFWDSPVGVWDCNLTTMSAPPPPPVVSDEDNITDVHSADEVMFLFEKKYDALQDPPTLSNFLNGTCQQGQLLLRGYEQELTNGRHLREAYMYDDPSDTNSDIASTDERMRLFDVSSSSSIAASNGRRPYEEPNLYYRVDDDQRTVMSGQVLLRGLFGKEFVKHKVDIGKEPIITTHTADKGRDILEPNEAVCPRLVELSREAFQSKEFHLFNTSNDATELRHIMKKEFGKDFSKFASDCLMTTICTDRPLPETLNDFHDGNVNSGKDQGRNHEENRINSEYGTSLFERMVSLSYGTFTFPYTFNNSLYSKLSMGPLWSEILSNIYPIICPNNENNNNRYCPIPFQDQTITTTTTTTTISTQVPPKLALFSGHDITIMSLFATLGPEIYNNNLYNANWPPYASMVIIELHEIINNNPGQPSSSSSSSSSYAFRLLYNGNVLTSKIRGCQQQQQRSNDNIELCDISILINIVKSFAKTWSDSDCTLKNTTTTSSLHSKDDNNNNNNEKQQQEPSRPSSSIILLLLSSSDGIITLSFVIVLFFILGNICMYGYLKGWWYYWKFPINSCFFNNNGQQRRKRRKSSLIGNNHNDDKNTTGSSRRYSTVSRGFSLQVFGIGSISNNNEEASSFHNDNVDYYNNGAITSSTNVKQDEEEGEKNSLLIDAIKVVQKEEGEDNNSNRVNFNNDDDGRNNQTLTYQRYGST